jgi:uncharacterized protein YcgL (UPF0745 family)
MGKNSKLNKNNNAETLKKEKIKNKIEKIGFLVQITKNEEAKQNAENNTKRFDLINII